MIFVPKGGTAVSQPLDRRIYGAMKAKARAKFDRRLADDDVGPLNKEAAPNLALECWNELTSENVIDAWSIDGMPTGPDNTIIEADDQAAERLPPSGGLTCGIEFGHDDVEIADVVAVEGDSSDNSDGMLED
jgi:hypothetical protein